ncbi:MAG: hypothetical protein ABI605_22400 [Rhizobacter sp.]
MPDFLGRHQPWVYFLSAVLVAVMAWQQYPALCPTSSNSCFRSMVANLAMFIGGVGILALYLHRFLAARAAHRSSGHAVQPLWLSAFRVLAFSFVCAATGWLVGGSVAVFT